MNLIFTDKESNTTLKKIERLEKTIGLSFPTEYKQHLLLHNGGICSHSCFDFEESGVKTSSSLDCFFSISNDEDYSLKENFITYKEEEKRMPTHILPIACDEGGNLICISCGTSDYGYIYFWNHEDEVDYSISDDTDYSNLYFIAKNLHDFFDGLYEYND